MSKSKSLQEAVLLEITNRLRGDPVGENPELEIIDSNMLCCGGWRLVVWCRWLPERSIRTVVIHQLSVVEVVPDAPIPEIPK